MKEQIWSIISTNPITQKDNGIFYGGRCKNGGFMGGIVNKI